MPNIRPQGTRVTHAVSGTKAGRIPRSSTPDKNVPLTFLNLERRTKTPREFEPLGLMKHRPRTSTYSFCTEVKRGHEVPTAETISSRSASEDGAQSVLRTGWPQKSQRVGALPPKRVTCGREGHVLGSRNDRYRLNDTKKHGEVIPAPWR